MTHSVNSLDDLQAAAVDALRASRHATEGERTRHLRSVADAFVSAREHFRTETGEPDWLGRTFAYRSWVRETSALAGIPRAELGNALAAVRYHSGNLLRERLTDDEVERLGLKPLGPRERSSERRERIGATLAALSGAGKVIVTPDETETVLTSIRAVLNRVQPGAGWSAAERQTATELLNGIADRAREVADALAEG